MARQVEDLDVLVASHFPEVDEPNLVAVMFFGLETLEHPHQSTQLPTLQLPKQYGLVEDGFACGGRQPERLTEQREVVAMAE